MGARGPLPNVRALPGVTLPPSKQPRSRPVSFDPKAPKPPENLCREAKAEWGRVVKELDSKGLLATIDRAVLTIYCDAWATHYRARVQLAKEPLTVLSGSDRRPAKNPLWQIYRESGVLVAALAKELFASPNARLRAQLPEDADGEEEEGILD
jgi:P27 family predicted phage terminase small subunit